MAGFLRLSTKTMKEVAPNAGGDASNWKSVDVHLQKERCRPRAFPQRSGPPVCRQSLYLDCLDLQMFS